MSKIFMKLVLPLCILLVFTFSRLISIEATYQSDPLNDVWSKSSGTFGDYADYVDLEEIVLQGSSVIITTDGDLTTLATNILTHFIVLFSDDGDPTNFEASIGFFQNGDEDRSVYWIISDPCIDTGVEWEYDYSGGHCQLTTDALQINFIEFNGIIYSEILIISLSTEAGKDYYDWIPGYYSLSDVEAIIAKIMPSLAIQSGTTPTTTTTIPTTTISPPTTSVPPTSTIPPTTTQVNTSPIIIPTITDDVNTTGTTSTDDGSLITPGNTLIMGLLTISNLVIIKRRLKRR